MCLCMQRMPQATQLLLICGKRLLIKRPVSPQLVKWFLLAKSQHLWRIQGALCASSSAAHSCRKNKGRASLNLQNFLLTANEEEITIPRDVVYAAANEYISRNLGISSIDLQFSVTVTDVNGETATGNKALLLTLILVTALAHIPPKRGSWKRMSNSRLLPRSQVHTLSPTSAHKLLVLICEKCAVQLQEHSSYP